MLSTKNSATKSKLVVIEEIAPDYVLEILPNTAVHLPTLKK